MESLYLIPSWFFGLGLILELIFGIIVLAVALYSFKIYSYSSQRNVKLFAWSFLALAISYFSWAFVSWYVSSRLSFGEGVISLGDFKGLVLFGLYSHIFFFLLGLTTLAYVTLGIKSQRTYTLIISIIFITIIFSAQKIIAFYFIASLLLFYVVIYYFLEYWYYGRRNQLAMLSFIFLFVGSVDFTFSAVNHIPYVIGHILYLIGYLFILINFIIMFGFLRRKEKNVKKRNKLEIIKDILVVIKDKSGKIKPTHILYKSNLSHQMMDEYLQELISKDFVVEHEIIKGKSKTRSKTYSITNKGLTFLDKYRTIIEFTESFGLS